MTDNENKKTTEVESPCVRNCCLNEYDICLGCFRHVDEIIEWGSANSQRREAILDDVKQRRVAHTEKWPSL